MTPRRTYESKSWNGSRRQRIAKGSGTTIQEVNKLIKQLMKNAQDDAYADGCQTGKQEISFIQKIKPEKIIENEEQQYKLLDGKAVSAQMKQEMAEEVAYQGYWW